MENSNGTRAMKGFGIWNKTTSQWWTNGNRFSHNAVPKIWGKRQHADASMKRGKASYYTKYNGDKLTLVTLNITPIDNKHLVP